MGKIIITGPGRAGTSFLVRLLTRLGEDTGWTPDEDGYNDEWRAGCEQRVIVSLLEGDATKRNLDDAPRILKSPDWSFFLKPVFRAGWVEIDHVFIPFRDLDVSAKSRLSVGLHWMCEALEGASFDDLAGHQANIHALALGRTMEAVWVCGLPHTVMAFPNFVEDVDYCYGCLSRAFDLERGRFGEEWKKLANPKQIVWKK